MRVRSRACDPCTLFYLVLYAPAPLSSSNSKSVSAEMEIGWRQILYVSVYAKKVVVLFEFLDCPSRPKESAMTFGLFQRPPSIDII